MKLCVLLLTLLLCAVNFKHTACLKCEFSNDWFYSSYKCNVIPDYSSTEERHVDGNTDFDVKEIKVDGATSKDLAQLDLIPACQRFKNAKYVLVKHFKDVHENSFQSCKNLRTLRIENTEMEEIPDNLFSNNPNLNGIALRGGKLRTLPENVFSNQKELKRLFLDDNQISCLPPNILKPLTNLKVLNLSGNKLQSVDPKWFGSLQSLEVLYLKRNQIQDLPRNVFASLSSLSWLSLKGNKLSVVHLDSFGVHRNLFAIDLSNNKMVAFDEKIIENTGIELLDISGNVCINERIEGRDKMKARLSRCINNYKPREKPMDIECGTRIRIKQTIINGAPTDKNEYPWNVALVHRKSGLFCGGTIISTRHIVTAAHCMKGKEQSHEYRAGDFTVLLGVHNYLNPEEEGQISSCVSSIYIHRDWSTIDYRFDADIAVLELGNDIPMSNIIRPICLAEEDSAVDQATQGTVVGFGLNDNGENGTLSDIARKLEIPIRNYHDCINGSLAHRQYATANTFCGGPADGRGVCDGDSGSGVYVLYNDQFYLRGIVSATFAKESRGCKVDKQAIFTNVPRYFKWITAISGTKFDP